MTNNRILELRKSLDLSQEALAKKIGTTQQAINRMKNNAYDIPSDCSALRSIPITLPHY